MTARDALDAYIETLQVLANPSDRTEEERAKDADHRARLINAFEQELKADA